MNMGDAMVPPHDDLAEKSVLGALMMSKDAMGEVASKLKTDDFYQPKNQTIYDAITELYSAGQPVDAVSVADKLLKTGELKKVGGVEYLHSLVETVPFAANVGYYANILVNDSKLRETITTGMKIEQLGWNADGRQADEVINLAQSEAFVLGSDKVAQDYVGIGSAMDGTLKEIDAIQKGEIEPGLQTGFRDLDHETMGLHDGQLIIVAGRPAMGKSTLAVDFARNAALRNDKATVIFSLEMSVRELTKRIIAAETDIPFSAIREASDDSLTPERWDRINRFFEDNQGKPLFMDDSPNMSLMEIRAKCRRLKQSNDLKLIIVDYLQLMSSGRQEESRQVEVSNFSRAFKLLAKELEVPVVVLSQLNRGPEMRNDKKPQLSDLRESGSIEQDADMVLLVHRPEYYNEEDRPGEADIILAKQRNGKTGTFPLAFQGNYSRFRDMAANIPQPQL